MGSVYMVDLLKYPLCLNLPVSRDVRLTDKFADTLAERPGPRSNQRAGKTRWILRGT